MGENSPPKRIRWIEVWTQRIWLSEKKWRLSGMVNNAVSGSIHVLLVDTETNTTDKAITKIKSQIKQEATSTLTVSVATSCSEGLDRLAEAPIDCVVSAYELPDMNGLSFFKTVRAKNPELPFILFPDCGNEELANEAINAGVSEYLSKHSDTPIRRLVLRIEQVATTATERRENREQKQTIPFKRAIDVLDEVFYLFDEGGEFILWNNTVSEVTGYTDEEIASMHPTDFFKGEDIDRIAEAINRVLEQGRAIQEAHLVTKDGKEIPHEFTGVRLTDENGDLIGICGIGRNITERKRREQALREREKMLTSLHDATRPLMRAETEDEIADIAVETANEVLDIPGIAIYLFDKHVSALRPTAYSPEVKDMVNEYPRISEGDLSWDAYVASETRIYDDIHSQDSFSNAKVPIRSALIIPLGDHGIFLAGDTIVDAFDDIDIEFVELLASHTEAAFDRAERERVLRSRDSELNQRNEQLERLNRINTVIRDIDRALVNASTRTEIDEEVCDRLVNIDPYEFAWVGRPDDDNDISPQSWAGDDPRYLEILTDETQDEILAETVARTLEPQTIADLFSDRQSEPWRQEALKRGYRSVIAIPIVYQEAVYGVLEVYADRVDIFDEEAQTVLDELGRTIGHAINAISRKEALLNKQVTQLQSITLG